MTGRSGGGLRWLLGNLDAVANFDIVDDLGQLVLALQASPYYHSHHDELEDHEARGVLQQRTLGQNCAVSHGGKHALDRMRRAQMVPVLGWEVVDGEQRVVLLEQVGDGLVAFGGIFLGENCNRRFRGVKSLPIVALAHIW